MWSALLMFVEVFENTKVCDKWHQQGSWHHQYGKGGEGRQQGGVVIQRFLPNAKGEIFLMSFELVQFIKIGTRNQSQMYELIIIPENPFSGTHYWCVHNFSAEVIHPNVSDLHILLLLVVLAVHSVVDLKLTWPKCCNTNVINIKKGLWCQPPSPQHITPSWRKFKLKWYILMSTLSLVFFSRMFLPSTVSSTKNKHGLNVAHMLKV